jgi:hypothetical protein
MFRVQVLCVTRIIASLAQVRAWTECIHALTPNIYFLTLVVFLFMFRVQVLCVTSLIASLAQVCAWTECTFLETLESLCLCLGLSLKF